MPGEHFVINNQPVKLDQLANVLSQQVSLGETATEAIKNCRQFLEQKIANSPKPFYGINTGFGYLCDVHISDSQLEELQHNLVISHACGTGDKVPKDVVRMMMLLKIIALSKGYSGIQLKTVEQLVKLYNNEITPVVFEVGSLGASGDLAPLAHMSLAVLGLGKVNYEGQEQETANVLQKVDMTSQALGSKEGLALLNGTQFMSAYGVTTIAKAKKLLKQAGLIGAMTLDALKGKLEPYHPAIHRIRAQSGQIKVAAEILEILGDSEIAQQEKESLQDPYCLRCIPQVHGASLDVFEHVANVFEKEINAVTDNPNVVPEEDVILSGGNFHGQPLAMALDYLSIAIAELGSISERRCYKLLSGMRGLPLFLAKEPGLNSGMMIPQYTAAALVSQNKQLCMPASVDTIDSSNGQEDHVSMGANAATKCYKIAQNVERILAIELLLAAQALEFRRPAKSSSAVEAFLAKYRQVVPFAEQDRLMHDDIQASVSFLQDLG